MSIGRKNYFRLLVLGCVDAIVLFPAQTLNFVIDLQGIRQAGDAGFYPGWTSVHSGWAPVSVPVNAWLASVWDVFNVRWSQWINPFFGLLFFLLYGVTTEARESYKRVFWSAANRFGYTRPVQARVPNIVFQFAIPDIVNSEYVLVLVYYLFIDLTSRNKQAVRRRGRISFIRFWKT